MHGIKSPLAAAGLLALGSLVFSRPAAATLTTIWVGAGSGCDTSSLVLAVTEASTAAGDKTRINLVNDQTYTGFSNLALNYINVEIDGGYAHCEDATPSGITAIVGSGANRVISMFSGNLSRQVILRNLDIHGGDLGGAGGGLYAYGGVYTILDHVDVHDNHAGSGGGVGVYGNGTASPTLVLTGNTTLSKNVATYYGGGIDCGVGAGIVLGGASILNNSSGNSGGGMRLYDCTLQSAGDASIANSFFGNSADYGGAIDAGGSTTIELGVSGGPVRVETNNAIYSGGGISLSGPSVQAKFAAAQFVANRAQSGEGGAAYVDDHATFDLDRGDREIPCRGTFPCTALISNIASKGSAVYATNGAIARLKRCEIDSPVSTSVGSVVAADGKGTATLITLTGVLMDRLLAAAAVRLDNGGAVVAGNLTLAGNTLDNDFAVEDDSTSLNIQNSIVWDPGAVAVAGLGSVFSFDNDSHDTSTLTGMGFDPGFVAPGSHDFRLRADSLNVDAYTPVSYGTSVDLFDNVRPYDLPPDNGGIFDRGAIELGDEIFGDGFEPSLQIQ